MTLLEAVVVYDGRGITAKIRALSPAAISLNSRISPDPGDTVTVFIEGVGKFDSRVTDVRPPRVDLAFLTDTPERWRRLQALRKHLNG